MKIFVSGYLIAMKMISLKMEFQQLQRKYLLN